MCNLMSDYALERRIILTNPARAFQIGNLLNEIQKKSKGNAMGYEEIAKMYLKEPVDYRV